MDKHSKSKVETAQSRRESSRRTNLVIFRWSATIFVVVFGMLFVDSMLLQFWSKWQTAFGIRPDDAPKLSILSGILVALSGAVLWLLRVARD